MKGRAGHILIPEERIAGRVRELAGELSGVYADREPVLVAVMKGCVLFLADLVRVLPVVMDIEFVTARSYEGTTPGPVSVSLPGHLGEVVRERPVLIVDDIYDTGRTLEAVSARIRELGPDEVRTLVLLRKLRDDGPTDAPGPDWVGFDIDDHFVVGYGLDYDGRWRNLPYIAALPEPPGGSPP